MISFVIPTLNEGKALEETLINLSQYKGSHEIIISDGGSKDSTIFIAKKYTNKIYEHKDIRRQTVAEGRNKGAYLAKGEYIVEMDADTRFHDINKFFQRMIEIFEKNSTIVCATTWFKVYPKDETLMDRLIFGIMGAFSLLIDNYLRLGLTSGGEFLMFRSEPFYKVKGHNESIVSMDENEILFRIRKIGRIYFVKDLFIYHSGRRAHNLGWPRMIGTFIMNSIYLLLFKKSFSKVWKEIR